MDACLRVGVLWLVSSYVCMLVVVHYHNMSSGCGSPQEILG